MLFGCCVCVTLVIMLLVIMLLVLAVVLTYVYCMCYLLFKVMQICVGDSVSKGVHVASCLFQRLESARA